MEAVKAWGYNLEFVPEGLKTKEICREALVASPDLGYEHCIILAYVPYPDICLEGMKNNQGGVDIVELAHMLRPEVIDKDIADYLVGRDGCCLAYIPLHLQTEELALKAVSESGNQALTYTTVREDLKTDKVYIAGMEKDCFQSFLHIPEYKRTPEICLIAEKLYPELFVKRPEVVPQHIRTGCNLYTLNKTLERATGEKYSSEQVKALYSGGTLSAKSFITPDGILRNQVVRFNKEDERFLFSPLKQDQKRSKGLKL